jgi:hypothetical protein
VIDRLSGEVILYQREAGTMASEAHLDVGATHKHFLSVRCEGSRNVEREVATKFRNWAEAATCRILGQVRTESTVRHFRTVRQDRAVAKAEGEFSKYRASVDAAPSAMEQYDLEGADHAHC